MEKKKVFDMSSNELMNCHMEPCELNVMDFDYVSNINGEYGISSLQNYNTSINAESISSYERSSIFFNHINEILVGITHNESEVCPSEPSNCNVKQLDSDSTEKVAYSYESAAENESWSTNLYQQEGMNVMFETEKNLKEMTSLCIEGINKQSPFFENCDQAKVTNCQDITSNLDSIYTNNYFNFSEKFNFVECSLDPAFNMGANNWSSSSFDIPKTDNSYNQLINFDTKLSYADEMTVCEPEVRLKLCSNENEKIYRIDKKVVQHKSHWVPVFPRKKFNQVADIIVKHPLRTRKILPTCRQFSAGTDGTLKLSEDNSPNKNLHNKSYEQSTNQIVDKDNSINTIYKLNLKNEKHYMPDFSKTAIIPTINSDKRSKVHNQNRRKQKLDVMPGAEYLEFEVQKNCIHEQSKSNKNIVDSLAPIQHKRMDNKDDPYPEIELPELYNIFRRKKKVCPISTTSTRKKNHIYQFPSNQTSDIKDEFNNSRNRISYINLINSEENISNVIVENNVINNSESDSGDSADNIENRSQIGESLKCLKCKKFFKSNRFLALHLKRCDKNYINNSISIEGNNYDVIKNVQRTHETFVSNVKENESRCRFMCNKIYSSFTYNKTLLDSVRLHNTEKNLNSSRVNNDENVRPLTRSQARRSTKK